jgi:aspartate carbamoyltransferase catalytic subunit
LTIPRRDLLGIRFLKKEDLEWLLRRSDYHFPNILSKDRVSRSDTLGGLTIANLFFENSTRTRTSFELAEKRLGADSVSLSMQTSSLTKGESLIDTVRVITAMKIDCLVVRHHAGGVPQLLRKHLPEHIRIVNAGDGACEHPTQALLDAAMLIQALGSLKGKRIVIVGDILHSRVARSNIYLLKQFGAEVTVVAPNTLMPKYIHEVFDVDTHYDLDHVLKGKDAVMALRIQHERQGKGYIPSLGDFRKKYGMTPHRLSLTDAYILHPGPVNRSVELDDEAADADRSLILQQVARGVAIRMAVLEWLFSE